MCAIVGARLHLIRPLGFTLTQSKLKRSGMDYWDELDLVIHSNWEEFKACELAPSLDRIWLFTTKSERSHWSADFKDGDGLLFGAEDCGCPENIHQEIGERRVKIPQFAPNLRSLNLATSAGIATYEAMRQICGNKELKFGADFF